MDDEVSGKILLPDDLARDKMLLQTSYCFQLVRQVILHGDENINGVHRWPTSPRLGALISDPISESNIPKLETPILPYPSPQTATAIASRQALPHQLPPLKKKDNLNELHLGLTIWPLRAREPEHFWPFVLIFVFACSFYLHHCEGSTVQISPKENLKDAAYCLYCYLFKTSFGKQGGGESFVGESFTYWKDKKRLHTHVGLHDSAHNQARIKCEVLMNQEQHIQSGFYKQSEHARSAYVTRLNASIDCVRLLLRQGHSFRGHDEYEDSLNPGNFLVQLQFLAAHNEVINTVTLGNAPHNCKLTSPDVQKDIVNACAIETINVIIKDVGDSLFSILVDESRDLSMKEQMSIILRYVDNSGHVNECFIGIEHVTSTTALSLKAAIDKESPCAFYIHCFAHQLQLAFVAMAKKNIPITNFFRVVGGTVNTVGASSRRCDLLREKQLDFIVEALEKCEILSGQGLNQETTLQRSGDTRWSSHYNSLVNFLAMFFSVLDVLAMIVEDEFCSCDQRSDATNLLESIQKFDFTFNLQLMRSVLGMSNELSKAL
ncbi:uncharacterized protein LOC111380007 [Olea europaea var. sylvestris]|uniref:uncharacterized protein LOC111380007 n=1 Tax=Olea europaea var. sylvestris TaxID=158386 RepID=UPI000C1CDD03|nr:uncharacterized protein LOC111380007 [Olea europaea var. sylvestris]